MLYIHSDADDCVSFLNCFLSVDGTDYSMAESQPYSEMLHSHKLNGSGCTFVFKVVL